MIASLPMYDTVATAAAHDRLWALIRQALGHGPERLHRGSDLWAVWRDPALLLSQTCGLPYRAKLRGAVALVGTPDYGVPGCPPGYYCSVIVVRRHDRRRRFHDFGQARLARNDALSQSGWGALVAYAREAGADLPADVLETGSHAASARAVLDKQADLAALDAVTWAHLLRDAPAMRGLRVLARTRPTPGLPLITAPTQDAERLFEATEKAIAALAPADRAHLFLKGLLRIPAESYLALPLPEERAERHMTVQPMPAAPL